MHDTPFPDPADPDPGTVAAVLKRERTLWLRREADLTGRHTYGLGNVRGAERIEARTAHLVLTFALAVVEGHHADVGVGSFAAMTAPRTSPEPGRGATS